MLLLLIALRAPEPAAAQASKEKKKNDVESLVAAGDEVEGKGGGKAEAAPGPAAMPQTGSELEEPILVGLVLLLDGALAFLVTSRRRPQEPSAI